MNYRRSRSPIREVVAEAVTYTLHARAEVPGVVFNVGSAGRRLELISNPLDPGPRRAVRRGPSALKPAVLCSNRTQTPLTP